MNMLRNIKFYLSALAILVGATSCLDKYPGSSIPEKEAMRTFADAEQTLTGIYASLKSNALYSGYLTLLPDIQADLVYAVEGNTNTYGSFWRWDIRPTDLQLEAVYAALYKVIGNCNFYLDRIDEVVANEISDTNIEKLEQYTGEVYAVRALCYTELLKTFCKAYEPDTAQSELGVVLRTKYFTPEAARRASLYDSYQFVLDDLAEAEKRLDKENDAYGNVYMTSASAEALHARVALYMQDWDTAIEYSSTLIDEKKATFQLSDAKTNYTSDYTYFDYMWAYDLGYEVIWRIGFTDTSYGGALGTVFLNFNKDYKSIVPYVKDGDKQPIEAQFSNSFENTYTHIELSGLNPQRLMFTPVVIEQENGRKLCIAESDVESYPGMFLINRTGEQHSLPLLPPSPKQKTRRA